MLTCEHFLLLHIKILFPTNLTHAAAGGLLLAVEGKMALCPLKAYAGRAMSEVDRRLAPGTVNSGPAMSLFFVVVISLEIWFAAFLPRMVGCLL